MPANTVPPAIYGTAQVGQRLVALPGNWTNPEHASSPVDGSYALVFDEEFNGSSLDHTKWNENWFGTEGEVTAPTGLWPYTLAAADPAQITISGGFLALTTISNPITISGTTYAYRSGHIDSNPNASVASPGFSVKPTPGNPVYLEARIYIPPASGSNVANWPSFWTGGLSWPADGEIDIAEALNDGTGNSGMTANYHASGVDHSSGVLANRYSGWHIFAVLWTTSSVTYYYDGVQVKQYTTGIASSLNYLILDNNMHVGAAGPNLVPASVLIDYVHAYLKGGSPVTPQTNYGGVSPYFTNYTYQWKRAGTPISGATASTYVPVTGDVGNTLTVSVVAANSGGSSAPATSAATSAVAAAGGVPANTVPPAISGTPQVGQTLTATNGTWTNSPASFTYQWKRAGTSIGGATASTYVPVSADVGNTLTVSVTATNGSGFSTPATSAATSAVINTIPTNSSVPAISGIAKVGQTLTATTGTWTHNPTSFTYQWKRAGTPISGATASTYVPVTGDVGNTLTVSVVAANSGGSSAPATSAATSAVAAAGGVPANTVPPAISGTPQVGQTLTATNGTWTNSPASFTYQWKRAGTSIGGATASTYVPVSADVGNTLTVSVTATNGSGFSTPATSAATSAVINMIPTNSSVPTISGIAKVGQTLTATTGTWTHNPTSFTYQWKRAGTPISGATASTYVPVTGDVGNTLTVSVVAANSGGSSAPATSAATSAVAAAGGVPANTVPPAISGTPQVGQTLTATNGTWTNSPASFTYQWKRAGTSIGGATASTYVPVSADVGNTLTVSVTATNGSGFSTPATSAATYKIATFLVFLSSIGNDAAAGTAVAPIKTISRALILCESAVLAASPAASYCRIVYLSDQYSLPSGLTSQKYVATTGSDSNPGTIGSPYATLQHAFNNAVAGQEIIIRGGTYSQPSGGLGTPTSAAGTITNPIAIHNYPGERVIVDGAGVVGNDLFVVRGPYVYICGLEIANCANGVGLALYNRPNNYFYNNYIHDNWQNGISVFFDTGSSNNQTVIGNIIYRNCKNNSASPHTAIWGSGIGGDRSDAWMIKGNIVTQNWGGGHRSVLFV